MTMKLISFDQVYAQVRVQIRDQHGANDYWQVALMLRNRVWNVVKSEVNLHVINQVIKNAKS